MMSVILILPLDGGSSPLEAVTMVKPALTNFNDISLRVKREL